MLEDCWDITQPTEISKAVHMRPEIRLLLEAEEETELLVPQVETQLAVLPELRELKAASEVSEDWRPQADSSDGTCPW